MAHSSITMIQSWYFAIFHNLSLSTCSMEMMMRAWLSHSSIRNVFDNVLCPVCAVYVPVLNNERTNGSTSGVGAGEERDGMRARD